MSIGSITDHAQRALSRIITQFRSSPDVRAIVLALAIEVQVLEAAIQQLFDNVRNPTGGTPQALLDLQAKLLGSRNSQIELIAAQIPVNASQGKLEDLIRVYQQLVQPTHGGLSSTNDGGDQNSLGANYPGSPQVVILEAETASFQFVFSETARHAIALLKSAAPASVRVILICSVYPLDNDSNGYTFRLDDSSLDDPSFLFVSAFDSPNNL